MAVVRHRCASDQVSGASEKSRLLANGAVNPRRIREERIRRKGFAVASASTAVVVLVLWVLIPMAPGWSRVQASFFDWEVFAKTFPKLLSAFVVDIMIFAWSAPLIAVSGLAIALCRDVRAPALFPLKLFAIGYNDVFRGVPVMLVIYLFGFGIPGLGLPRPWNSPYIWGTLALVCTYAAYVAEIIRTGIESIHESQRSAAMSLGLTPTDIMRFVILPQAIRRVIPANMNILIALQKDVALLSVIGPVEILRQAGVEKSLAANFTPYVGASIIFLAVTIPATRYADRLIERQNRQRS
jgi:polar amino acid transport system permease protein